jgi:hypothetical protein
MSDLWLDADLTHKVLSWPYFAQPAGLSNVLATIVPATSGCRLVCSKMKLAFDPIRACQRTASLLTKALTAALAKRSGSERLASYWVLHG